MVHAALFLMAGLADWVPMRWPVADPAALKLLEQTPVNCLLIERVHWSPELTSQAKQQNVILLGVLRSADEVQARLREAKQCGLAGVVLEGAFSPAEVQVARAAAASHQLALIALSRRSQILWQDEIAGTYEGVWPGIRAVDEQQKAEAAPSGAPWIDTNGGFLRFVQAMRSGPFWMANLPPDGQVIPVDRYLQAIADAAMLGARWVVSLDREFWRRLLAGDGPALKDWGRIHAYLAFYERHKQWRGLPPRTQLAVIQDASSGALLSGSVLDMIAVKHAPVLPVPPARLNDEALRFARMAINLDPAALASDQREVLARFARKGGTVLNGPPGWKMPSTSQNGLTLDQQDVDKLDQIWKELNALIGRQNLGVRLFNVSSMLSYFQMTEDGKRAALHLVNYSGYPVENVTAHVRGRFKRAYIDLPEAPRKELTTYEVDDGAATGLDIDLVPTAALVILEQE